MTDDGMIKKFYDVWRYMYGVSGLWHIDLYKDGRVSDLGYRDTSDKQNVVTTVYGWHATDLPYIHCLSPKGEYRAGYLWDSQQKCWRKDEPDEFINEIVHSRRLE